jgi:hypothetical protein
MRTRTFIVLVVTLLLCLLLMGCSRAGNPKYGDKPAGFWDGIWHGCTQGVILLWDTFFELENPALYAANNIGYWYNCGFSCVGPLILGIILGGGIGVIRGIVES